MDRTLSQGSDSRPSHTPTEAVLVLDVGSSSSRAALIDRGGGVIVVAARAHPLAARSDGSPEIDALAAWRTVADACREVLAAPAARDLTVVAVSATSIRGALVVLDAQGQPLWAVGSIDARSRDEVRALQPLATGSHAATGQMLSFAALPRLRWLARERPDAWERADSIMSIDGWLLHCLTGARVGVTTSMAPTGLLELGTGAWLEPGVEAWRPDERTVGLLPPLISSGEVVGVVSRTAARDTGLPSGIPVAAGGGDAQLAALGSGCIDAGQTAVVMGTHWQAIVTLDAPRSDPLARFRVIQGPVSGTWHADTIALAAGLQLEHFVQGLGKGEGHAELEQAAAPLGPGSDGVLAVGGAPMGEGPWISAAPSLLGMPLAGPDAHRAAAWRAIVESGCLVIGRNLATVEAAFGAGASQGPIRVGGGASRADLVCRILASCLGRTVERGSSHQSSLLGAAICAGVAAGWYADVRDGAAPIRPVARFEPDMSDHEAYRALDGRWWAALQAQLDLVRAGVIRSIVPLPD